MITVKSIVSLVISIAFSLIVIGLWSCLGQSRSTLDERQRAFERVVETAIEPCVYVDSDGNVSECKRVVIDTSEPSP